MNIEIRNSSSWNEAGLRQLHKTGPRGSDGAEFKRTPAVRVMPGYDARADRMVVVKRYKGVSASMRADTELSILEHAAGHPNVQTLTAFGRRRSRNKTYIVTRHAGIPGHVNMAANPARSVRTALMGLAHLHRNHIIHGDLHDGNVVFGADGTGTIIDLVKAIRGRMMCAVLNRFRSSESTSFKNDLWKLFDTLTMNLRMLLHSLRGEERREVARLLTAVNELLKSDLILRWSAGNVPSERQLRALAL